jgi:hypothetical protein
MIYDSVIRLQILQGIVTLLELSGRSCQEEVLAVYGLSLDRDIVAVDCN